jgi:hypothetical protein
MTTNIATREELIARTDASHRIGIDTCGLTHYHDAVLDVAWTTTVFGDIAHVADADLSEWVDFVDADRGWQTCTYTEQSLAEQITDALAQEAV